MDGALLALAFILGILFLAVGLIVVTLPVLGSAIALPWLVLGGVCLVAGALLLWLVRTEALQGPVPSPQSNSAFFAVLGIVGLVVTALSVRQGEWYGAIVAALAVCAVVLAGKTIVRFRKR